jgi:hypothetical protein
LPMRTDVPLRLGSTAGGAQTFLRALGIDITAAVHLARAQACRGSVGLQTMLTVLTQKLPFLPGRVTG